MSIKVPKKCLCCGAEWIGGHEVPNKPMREGLRVFYDCGASMSIKEDLGQSIYLLLFKSCSNDEEYQMVKLIKKELDNGNQRNNGKQKTP